MGSSKSHHHLQLSSSDTIYKVMITSNILQKPILLWIPHVSPTKKILPHKECKSWILVCESEEENKTDISLNKPDRKHVSISESKIKD